MKEEATTGDRVGEFVDDVLELLSSARDFGKDDLSALRDRVQGGAQRLKDAAVERQQQVTDAAKDAAARADSYAHENPWQVAAMAAVVGLALGVLISRR